MNNSRLPYPDDKKLRFRSTALCVEGALVQDSVNSYAGEQVCSSCRGPMEVVNDVWVHRNRKDEELI